MLLMSMLGPDPVKAREVGELGEEGTRDFGKLLVDCLNFAEDNDDE